MSEQAGFQHGWQACRLCHRVGGEVSKKGPWTLTANPGYWGSPDPRVLVLGFSKGANQTRVIAQSKPFEAIAFARCRPELAKILSAIGVPMDQPIAETMTSRSDGLGYASLVRCSFELNGVTSGTIMSDAVNDEWAKGIMTRCIQTHLVNIPAAVQRVVLLGNSPTYVKGVRAIIRSLFADFRDINDVAFSAGGRTWVFVCHPSAQGARVDEYLTQGRDGTAGRKRELARDAFGTLSPAPEKPSTIGVKRVFKASN